MWPQICRWVHSGEINAAIRTPDVMNRPVPISYRKGCRSTDSVGQFGLQLQQSSVLLLKKVPLNPIHCFLHSSVVARQRN
jgi:hypothetical protein